MKNETQVVASGEESSRVKGIKKRRKSVCKLTPWTLNYSQKYIDIYEHWGGRVSRAEIKDIDTVCQTYSDSSSGVSLNVHPP